MEFRELGTNGPRISTIGYGSWELGGRVDRPETPVRVGIDALMTAFEAGVNWVDTAETYGAGRSERIVGEACSSWNTDITIVTKLAPIPSSSGSGFEPWQVDWGARRSIERLGVECLDVYLLHWPDPFTDMGRTWEAMADLVERGLVKWIGLSNFSKDEIERCHRARKVDCIELEFSLLNQEPKDIFSWSSEEGIGVLTYGSLAYGLLAERRRELTPDDEADWYDHLFRADKLPGNLERVQTLGELARDVGCTTGQLALAWTVQVVGVTATAAGSLDPRHIIENAAASDIRIGPEVIDQMEARLGNPML